MNSVTKDPSLTLLNSTTFMFLYSGVSSPFPTRELRLGQRTLVLDWMERVGLD